MTAVLPPPAPTSLSPIFNFLRTMTGARLSTRNLLGLPPETSIFPPIVEQGGKNAVSLGKP